MTVDELNKKKINVAYTSIIGAVFIVTVKTLATIQSGSLAVLSELFHSSTDFIAALATVLAIKSHTRSPFHNPI